MRKVLVGVTAVLLVLAMTLGVMELVLRLVPSLMSVAVIERMHPELRSSIAESLGLPVEDDYLVIDSAARLDKGPSLYLMKPDRDYRRPVDPADEAYGAIDRIHTDKRGFCNPAGADDQAAFAIVTVGGSVPNCASVGGEAVFSAALGRLVGAGSYNLAVPAVGPYEYNEVLARHGEELRPKVVLFAISEANDMRDSERYVEHVAGRDRDRKHKLGGIFKHSYVLAFVKAGIEVLAKQVSTSARPDFRYTVQTPAGAVPMNVSNGDQDELASARRLADGRLLPNLYADPLRRFVALSKEMGFAPLVVYVPAAYTVYRDGIIFGNGDIAPLMAQYSDVQRNWLREHAAEIGYRLIDPTVGLQAMAKTEPLLYFPSDVHLTAAGHAALAASVAEAVKSALAQP